MTNNNSVRLTRDELEVVSTFVRAFWELQESTGRSLQDFYSELVDFLLETKMPESAYRSMSLRDWFADQSMNALQIAQLQAQVNVLEGMVQGMVQKKPYNKSEHLAYVKHKMGGDEKIPFGSEGLDAMVDAVRRQVES